MKRYLIIPVAFLAFTFGGCALLQNADKSVFDGGLSITATVNNPITREQQAALEASYQVAVSAALSYSNLRRCKSGEKASATNLCSDWATVQKFQRANRIAYAELVNLRKFMDTNQQVSAVAAFNAVQNALRDFKAVAAASGV